MKIKPVLQWVAGIVLAAGGFYVFFTMVNPHRLLSQVMHTSPLVIAAVAVLALMSIWLRSVRASLLLPTCSKEQRKKLFPIIIIAFMINNILPARLGEVARAMLLWKNAGYGGAVSVGSVILERILDTLVFLACFFVPVFTLPSLAHSSVAAANVKTYTMDTFAILFCILFCAGIFSLVAYALYPKWAKQTGKKILGIRLIPEKIRARLLRIGGEIISNLDWTFSWQKSLAIIVLSFCIIACYAYSIVILVRSSAFTLSHGVFSQAFAAFGAAIPLSPGYVGTLHAVFLQGLMLCGVSRDTAGAVTVLSHAVAYITVTLVGLFYYFRMHVSLKEISKQKQ